MRPSLQQLNEKGEYHRALLTDNNISYALATYGEIVALTRKVIINDDLQAFTRVPACWAWLPRSWSRTRCGASSPPIRRRSTRATRRHGAVRRRSQQPAHRRRQQHRSHRGRHSGAGTAGFGRGRKSMRQQKGPQGTPLNLVPRFIAVPTALETYACSSSCIPINIASATAW
jgi:hypothetical protein